MLTQYLSPFRTQVLFLVLFVILNGTIFLLGASNKKDSFSYHYIEGISYHPAFWNASDGQRYWGVAVNLANKGRLVVGDSRTNTYEPLKRSGPLPALLYVGPIKLFGITSAAPVIVGLQCILLFLAGWLSRDLCLPYGASRNLIQGLLIFNPNLITLAHHAQSDLIFMVLITALFVSVSRILGRPEKNIPSRFVTLGVVAGLLPLARPMGLVYLFVLLAFFVIVVLLARLRKHYCWKRLLTGLFVSAFVASLLLVPWGLRNKAVFDEFSLTHSEGIMMEWHYTMLKMYGISKRGVADKDYFLEKYEVQDGCTFGDNECKSRVVRAYLSAILESPNVDILRALSISYGKLFFAGGVSQLGRYLGLETPKEHNFLTYLDRSGDVDREGQRYLNAFPRLFNSLVREYSSFAILLIVGLLFSVIGRIVGVFGFVLSMKNSSTLRHNVFYFMTILVFMGIYLFSSIARFRAPLEPILMLYLAIGISNFVGVRHKNIV